MRGGERTLYHTCNLETKSLSLSPQLLALLACLLCLLAIVVKWHVAHQNPFVVSPPVFSNPWCGTEVGRIVTSSTVKSQDGRHVFEQQTFGHGRRRAESLGTFLGATTTEQTRHFHSRSCFMLRSTVGKALEMASAVA